MAFLLSFTLPENALQNSLTLNIRWNSGENDPVTDRVVAFDNGIETRGDHLFNMTNLSLASNDGTDGGKWAHCLGGTYSTPSRHSCTAIVLCPTRVSDFFRVPLAHFTSTVLCSLHSCPTRVSNFSRVPLVHTYTCTTHRHCFLSLSLSVAGLLAVNPAFDLVHGAIYIFTLKYQDYLGNDEASDESASITFDTHTVVPTFTQPPSNSHIREDFTLEFTLPEDALATTVQVTIAPTGTTTVDHLGQSLAAGVDSGTSLVLTFDQTFATTGTHSIPAMTTLSSATTSISSISAISPTGRDLIHGNVYSMRLSYRDQAQNVPGKQFFGRRVVLVCCTCGTCARFQQSRSNSPQTGSVAVHCPS